MNPEKRTLDQSEQEQNPEIVAEVRELDEKAEEVAGELESADLENLDGKEKKNLGDRVQMVIGALLTLGGAAIAYHEAQGIDFSSLQGAKEVVEALRRSDFLLGASVSFGGISNLLYAYGKVKGYIGSIKEAK